MSEEALMIIDKYIGDLIERIIHKYRYNVDLDEEYEELLRFIYRKLVRAWFNSRRPDIDELERALREAKRRRRQLEVLLSYLISRYAARHGPIYLPHRGDWYDERF